LLNLVLEDERIVSDWRLWRGDWGLWGLRDGAGREPEEQETGQEAVVRHGVLLSLASAKKVSISLSLVLALRGPSFSVSQTTGSFAPFEALQ
jgi:hypothetical protein